EQRLAWDGAQASTAWLSAGLGIDRGFAVQAHVLVVQVLGHLAEAALRYSLAGVHREALDLRAPLGGLEQVRRHLARRDGVGGGEPRPLEPFLRHPPAHAR